MNKLFKKTISLLIVLVTLFSVVSVGVVSASAASVTVITTDEVRLRSSAAITDDNFIVYLNKAEVLTLLADSSNEWAHVKRADGTVGYCSVNYLNVPSDSAVEFTGKTNDDVNFRKGASTDSSIISTVSKGTSFDVLDNSDELWVKAKVNNTTGYLYRTYTDLSLVITSTSTVTDRPEWFESSALEDLVGSYEGDKHPDLSEIALSDTQVSIETGESYTIMVYIPGDTSAQSLATFSTSNKNVATVTQSGTITGVAAGTAVITATFTETGKSAQCSVTVTKATTPTQPTTPTTPTTPTQPTTPSTTIKLNATSASVEVGNSFHITADRSVTWKSSNTAVATVSGGIVTAVATGTATITASSSDAKAECKITVTATTNDVSISYKTVKISNGKTYFNKATSSSATPTWTSSDTSVATVTNGYITGVGVGKAVVTAKTSKGVRTCVVTVDKAEAVRFAYSSPNTAAPGEVITLYAVTDKTRTAVKFNVTISGTTKVVNATTKVADGNTYVWSGTITTSVAGTHSVVAYSKTNSDWETCSLYPGDAKTSIFVRKSSALTGTTSETRRASDKCITLISQFEGYSPCVYFDTLANNLPTLGYGRVVYVGDSFYNDMTKKEAFAYLVATVNNDGYTTSVNNYMSSNKLLCNQQQFDGLVSFVYNLGAYILVGDSDFLKIFKASSTTTEGASATDAYINDSDVNIRSGPATSYSSLGKLAYGTTVTLLKTTAEDGWYYLKTSSGITGYVYADYVTKGKLVSDGTYSLNNINKADLIDLMLQYHHAGGCVWGLLYRRVDELDMFLYGDYVVDGKTNKYGYKFTCPSNSSFKIG